MEGKGRRVSAHALSTRPRAQAAALYPTGGGSHGRIEAVMGQCEAATLDIEVVTGQAEAVTVDDEAVTVKIAAVTGHVTVHDEAVT